MTRFGFALAAALLAASVVAADPPVTTTNPTDPQATPIVAGQVINSGPVVISRVCR